MIYTNKKRIINFFLIVTIGFALLLLFYSINSTQLTNKETITLAKVKEAGLKFNKMIQENPNTLTIINISNADIKTTENGKIKISLPKFIEISKDIVENNTIIHNEFVAPLNSLNYDSEENSIYINTICGFLGYNYELDEEGNCILTRKFGNKRLIIDTNKDLTNQFNSKENLFIDDYNIMQFKTEYETMEAFDEIVSQNLIVSIDETIKISNVPKEEQVENTSKQLNSSNSQLYNSWGGQLMDFDKYNSYLHTTYKELNNPIVVVIDSGIKKDHEIFKNRLDTQHSICLSGDASITQYDDADGHGTHVAGIIADLTPKNVKIIAIKVQDKNNGFVSSSVKLAYSYLEALKNKGLNIVAVNGSYCRYEATPIHSLMRLINLKIYKLLDMEISFIFSAGNDNRNANDYSPCNIKEAITVSSIDKSQNLSKWSNYGSIIDFCAPGESIKSAYNTTDYTLLSGTSMSAPHITAAIAMLALDPVKNYSKDEIENTLKTICAVDIGEPGRDEKFGYGYIDLSKLIPSKNNEPVNSYTINYSAIDSVTKAKLNDDYGKVSIRYINESGSAQTLIKTSFSPSFNFKIDATSQISLEGIGNTQYKFIGWCIGTNSNCYNDKIYSTNENILVNSFSTKDLNYVYAMYEQIYVNVTLQLIYKDGEPSGFASYGTKIIVKDETRNIINIFTAGFRANSQVFTFTMPSESSFYLEIIGANDSIIEYVYNSNTQYKYKNYRNNNYYETNQKATYNSLDDLKLNIVISVII